MIVMHRLKMTKLLMRQICHLFHPIDGPGAISEKNLSSSSH
jgi:hypothetical protein